MRDSTIAGPWTCCQVTRDVPLDPKNVQFAIELMFELITSRIVECGWLAHCLVGCWVVAVAPCACRPNNSQ